MRCTTKRSASRSLRARCLVHILEFPLNSVALRELGAVRRPQRHETSLAAAAAYSGAALSPRALDNFVTNAAATMTSAIDPSTSVQMALISGLTPSRTSE